MSDNTDTTEGKTKQNFWSFLRSHKGGQLHEELTEKLNQLVTAVIEHGKPGSVTLTVEVAPMKDSNMVRVTDKLTPKIPEADRGGSFFFSDKDGGLHREDPNQMKLDTELRVVQTSDDEPIVIDANGEVVNV